MDSKMGFKSSSLGILKTTLALNKNSHSKSKCDNQNNSNSRPLDLGQKTMNTYQHLNTKKYSQTGLSFNSKNPLAHKFNVPNKLITNNTFNDNNQNILKIYNSFDNLFINDNLDEQKKQQQKQDSGSNVLKNTVITNAIATNPQHQNYFTNTTAMNIDNDRNDQDDLTKKRFNRYSNKNPSNITRGKSVNTKVYNGSGSKTNPNRSIGGRIIFDQEMASPGMNEKLQLTSQKQESVTFQNTPSQEPR